jgi:hypothetical protein
MLKFEVERFVVVALVPVALVQVSWLNWLSPLHVLLFASKVEEEKPESAAQPTSPLVTVRAEEPRQFPVAR